PKRNRGNDDDSAPPQDASRSEAAPRFRRPRSLTEDSTHGPASHHPPSSVPTSGAACLLLGGLLANQAAHADSPVVTRYTYDAGDHVASVTDPRGLVTSYTHDGLGQLWQQTSPDTGTTSFGYDSDGRRSNMTRADGTQTTYGYDGLNRMTSVSAGGLTQSFAYDSCTNGIGRLCSDGDASGVTSYSYMPEGWIAGRGFTVGSATYALGYAHDAVGNVTTVNYPDGNKRTTLIRTAWSRA